MNSSAVKDEPTAIAIASASASASGMPTTANPRLQNKTQTIYPACLETKYYPDKWNTRAMRDDRIKFVTKHITWLNNSQADSKQGKYEFSFVIKHANGMVEIPKVNGGDLEMWLGSNAATIPMTVNLDASGITLLHATQATHRNLLNAAGTATGSDFELQAQHTAALAQQQQQQQQRMQLVKLNSRPSAAKGKAEAAVQKKKLLEAYRHVWAEWGRTLRTKTRYLKHTLHGNRSDGGISFTNPHHIHPCIDMKVGMRLSLEGAHQNSIRYNTVAVASMEGNAPESSTDVMPPSVQHPTLNKKIWGPATGGSQFAPSKAVAGKVAMMVLEEYYKILARWVHDGREKQPEGHPSLNPTESVEHYLELCAMEMDARYIRDVPAAALNMREPQQFVKPRVEEGAGAQAGKDGEVSVAAAKGEGKRGDKGAAAAAAAPPTVTTSPAKATANATAKPTAASGGTATTTATAIAAAPGMGGMQGRGQRAIATAVSGAPAAAAARAAEAAGVAGPLSASEQVRLQSILFRSSQARAGSTEAAAGEAGKAGAGAAAAEKAGAAAKGGAAVPATAVAGTSSTGTGEGDGATIARASSAGAAFSADVGGAADAAGDGAGVARKKRKRANTPAAGSSASSGVEGSPGKSKTRKTAASPKSKTGKKNEVMNATREV